MGESSSSASDSNTGLQYRGRGSGPSKKQQREQAEAAKRQAEQERVRQEEMAMLAQEEETGKSLFARSATSGSIIRSSSGRGVTNRAGRQAREDYRAAYEGRTARDMDKEFPMDTGGDQPMQQASEQSKLEPEKKTTGGPSRASRRLLAQGQMGAKTRLFY